MADIRNRVKRFSSEYRLWHLGLVLIFLTLSFSGLSWMYIETAWGKGMASVFGGFEGALYIHRTLGLIMMAGFVAHALYIVAKVDWKGFPRSILGPDTLVFQWVDAKGFVQHLGWIFGLAKAPRFDRWSWFEKFDYWAVWWGLAIVGSTGLVLYDPVLTSNYIPGWLLNVALWIHRIEAVLAMGHIFTVHFFVAHFRPHAFPFSSAMFDGSLPLDEAREDHPAWVERLEAEGNLDEALVKEPPVPLRIAYFMVGYALIGFGVFLLVFALINIGAVTLL